MAPDIDDPVGAERLLRRILNRGRVARRDDRQEPPRRQTAARLLVPASRLGLTLLLGVAVSSNSVASMGDGPASIPWRR